MCSEPYEPGPRGIDSIIQSALSFSLGFSRSFFSTSIDGIEPANVIRIIALSSARGAPSAFQILIINRNAFRVGSYRF